MSLEYYKILPESTLHLVLRLRGGPSIGKMTSHVNLLGFSVGGAKDVNSFREMIKENRLPLPSSVTYEVKQLFPLQY